MMSLGGVGGWGEQGKLAGVSQGCQKEGMPARSRPVWFMVDQSGGPFGEQVRGSQAGGQSGPA